MALLPTAWRTCRVLANANRLCCLQAVLRRPERCVTDLARESRLSIPVASQYLRDLQARGLISVTRRSRWAFYGDQPDPSVGHAAPLLAAMRHVLAREERPFKDSLRTLRAFTHPRRLAVLRLLTQSASLSAPAMHQATGISTMALSRHLRRLETCGLATHAGGTWCLRHDIGWLARRLLLEICG